MDSGIRSGAGTWRFQNWRRRIHSWNGCEGNPLQTLPSNREHTSLYCLPLRPQAHSVLLACQVWEIGAWSPLVSLCVAVMLFDCNKLTWFFLSIEGATFIVGEEACIVYAIVQNKCFPISSVVCLILSCLESLSFVYPSAFGQA